MFDRLQGYLELPKEEPLPQLVGYQTGDFKKFVFKKAYDHIELAKFVNDFVDDNLEVSLKSEDEPTEQTEAVFKVVGKTF